MFLTELFLESLLSINDKYHLGFYFPFLIYLHFLKESITQKRLFYSVKSHFFAINC